METIWRAECPKCESQFEIVDEVKNSPSEGGTFCPECKERKYALIGILHFEIVSPKIVTIQDLLKKEFVGKEFMLDEQRKWRKCTDVIEHSEGEWDLYTEGIAFVDEKNIKYFVNIEDEIKIKEI